jgi:hypothetical protein
LNGRLVVVKVLVLLAPLLLVAVPAPAEQPKKRCKERCEVKRKQVKRKLQDCLRNVEPRPRDRAAKTRLLCRKRYVPPRCDGLPLCKEVEAKKPKARAPGLKLGDLVFSQQRRGPALAKPRYPAGTEVFLRLSVEVVPDARARRIFLDLSLSLLAVGKRGKTREVVRWDSYAQEQRVITPPERGLVQRFTLHGGAKLPPIQKPGRYLIQARVLERGSGFKGTTQGGFAVTPAAR